MELEKSSGSSNSSLIHRPVETAADIRHPLITSGESFAGNFPKQQTQTIKIHQKY